MNISETSWPIVIKFHLEHHWERVLARSDQNSVSMATDSSHRVIMGKPCDHSRFFIFDWFFFILAGNEDTHKISNVFERTSDGGNGNHSVSLPIILIKIKVNQKLPSLYISSLLVSIL